MKKMSIYVKKKKFLLTILWISCLKGVTLWDAKTLQEKSVEKNQHSSEFEISASDSTKTKSSLLDVNASLKASFLGGLIEVGGSAKYLNDNKKSHHQSRVTLQYKATTKFKQLMLTPDETKNTQQAEHVKNLATHVVTGILYGANAFFVFDSEKLDDSNIQAIEGSMQAVIKKIPSFNVDGKVDIKLSDEEKAVTDKFNTDNFYGDFILESNPGTFEDAVKTYIQLPKLLGENRENCVPLKVILMPLKKLHPKAAYMISNGFISKAEDTLQELHNLDIRCNDLLEDRVVRSFPQIQEKLGRFKKLCQYFRSSIQKTMAEKLPSIRAGEEDKQELVKVFDDRDKSPFSQEKLTKWIKDEDREVTIIRYFVDMMEGTKIISDQSELDREVFKPGVEEVLCFVFTSLKSTDPYLQNMSDYLEKKKLEGTDGNTPPTQDQWYFSDEVIKLFITAIQNDQYKGGSIYHYRNTNLVTDDFSGPDVTDVEKVTNRRDLMCCKFAHTVVGILAHSSMQIFSRAVMFWGCRRATRTFNSRHRFSMGLRSGDWLGHSRTFKCFLRSHSFVARAVCFGSLSCWKTQPRFIFKVLTDGRRFWLKISRYMAPFILSLTRISRPVPLAEKQPHSMMFPPPCFTVGMVFLGCNSVFFFLQTRRVEFIPKSSTLVSSDHMTFSQSSAVSSMCSVANFRRAWTCTGFSSATRLALRDLIPCRCSVLLMVTFVTLVPALCRSFTSSPRVVLGSLLTVLMIILTPRDEILRGAPDRGRLSVVLYVFHFLMIAPTVDFFTPSCLPIVDSLFPVWCRSTILFLVSFESSLVLAMAEFGV
uniref:Uncharacterized protein n=1 Tax=Maylandia zebra TaxID=106582 RepID=A0A3P9DV41_9CICH